MQAFTEALTKGGDFRKGQRVLMENPAAECTRCHTIRGRGSDVGPELTRIGVDADAAPAGRGAGRAERAHRARLRPGRRSRSRAATRPTARCAARRDAEVVLVAGTPPVERKIAKADIASRTDPVSAMPPLGLILKPREVRDLVEFLAGMR